MFLAIFVGGIFLGFSLGFATMAAVAAWGHRGQSEEAQELEDNPSRAYSPIGKPVRALGTPVVLLTPWL
jgi:hypothetical protein